MIINYYQNSHDSTLNFHKLKRHVYPFVYSFSYGVQPIMLHMRLNLV